MGRIAWRRTDRRGAARAGSRPCPRRAGRASSSAAPPPRSTRSPPNGPRSPRSRVRAQCLRRALVRRRLAADAWPRGRDIRLLEVRRGGRLIGLLPVEAASRLCPAAGPLRPELVPRPDLPRHAARRRGRGDGLLGRDPRRARRGRLGAAISSICAASSRTARSIAASPRRGMRAIVHREVRAFLESDLAPAGLLRARGPPEEAQGAAPPAQPPRRAGPGRAPAASTTPPSSTPGATPISPGESRLEGRGGQRARLRGPRPTPSSATPSPPPGTAGRLQFLRLDVGDRPIAMLVNFLDPAGQLLVQDRVRRGLCPLLARRADPARESRHPRPPRHRLDGQLRRRGSSDDRQPVDRAPRDRPRHRAAQGRPPRRRLRLLPRPRTGLGRCSGSWTR